MGNVVLSSGTSHIYTYTWRLGQFLVHPEHTNMWARWLARAHVVNNTKHLHVFFQFPIVLFGIIKLGFLYTQTHTHEAHMACSESEFANVVRDFGCFFIEQKRSETKRNIVEEIWFGLWCWTVNGLGGNDFRYCGLYASIRTKEKKNWKRNDKKARAQAAKMPTATSGGRNRSASFT